MNDLDERIRQLNRMRLRTWMLAILANLLLFPWAATLLGYALCAEDLSSTDMMWVAGMVLFTIVDGVAGLASLMKTKPQVLR